MSVCIRDPHAWAEPATRLKQLPRRDSESTLIRTVFRPFQLATLERKVPTGDSGLFEMKFDGYRMQAALAGEQVRPYTRNGQLDPPVRLRRPRLIDGELGAIDEQGRLSVALLKELFGRQNTRSFLGIRLAGAFLGRLAEGRIRTSGFHTAWNA